MGHIVVVGAGQAGASLVAKLRKDGFDGELTLIGAEPVPPYQRPPLSKGYLLGEMALERLYLRPESFYAEQGVTLRLGQEVTAIDPAERTVTLGDEVLRYDDLVLTTGSEPRRLPAAIGGDLDGVFVVRSLADVDAMAAHVTEGKRALIVGGGYIGLEAAAVAAKRGVQVTLVEMADRILPVEDNDFSESLRSSFKRQGIKIHTGTIATDVKTTKKGVKATLNPASGEGKSESIEVERVLVAIGVMGNVENLGLEECGVEIERGAIKVDADLRTSCPGIYALGDVAGAPWLAHKASAEAIHCMERIAGHVGNR